MIFPVGNVFFDPRLHLFGDFSAWNIGFDDMGMDDVHDFGLDSPGANTGVFPSHLQRSAITCPDGLNDNTEE